MAIHQVVRDCARLALPVLLLLSLSAVASMLGVSDRSAPAPAVLARVRAWPAKGGRMLKLPGAPRYRRYGGGLELTLVDTACRLPTTTALGGATLSVVRRGANGVATRLRLTWDPYWTGRPVPGGVLLTPCYPGVPARPDTVVSSARQQGADVVLEGGPASYAWRRRGCDLVVDLLHCKPAADLQSTAPVQIELLTSEPYAVTRLTAHLDGPFALSAGPPWTLRMLAAQPFPDQGFESGVPIVVIDPGHGGWDPGAMAANGLAEKDVTLAVARLLQADLRADGVRVLLTRTRDQELAPDASDARELGARVAMADAPQVVAYVSLHCDASTWASASGPTIHWNKAVDRPLAEALAMPLAVSPDDVARSPFYVLRHSPVPSVLIELGYLSNREEAGKLSRPEYRAALAKHIEYGLRTWLGSSSP